MKPIHMGPRGSATFSRDCLMATTAVALAASAFGAMASTPLTKEQQAKFKPVFTTIAHPPINLRDLDRQMAVNRTIPSWRRGLISPVDSKRYEYTMIGKDPYTSHARMFVHYVQIVARIHFPDGTVLDPTQPTACDTQSAQYRFFNSPLFVKQSSIKSNGVEVAGAGGEQLISAFQRANYWSEVHGTDYGIEMKAHGPVHVVDITAPADATVASFPIQCPSGASVNINLGMVDINEYDALVETTIAKFAHPKELPLFLTYNVVQTEGGVCCIIGYHNAVPVTNGTQTYAVGTYNDPGIFINSKGKTIPLEDIYAWSHELGEWTDDPFIQGPFQGGRSNNITPAWGHTGQVGGCQNNLEVGDPLTAVAFYKIVDPDGFTYHYQDLAFTDWFYRTPAQGTGGMFSFKGNFTTDAGPVCQ